MQIGGKSGHISRKETTLKEATLNVNSAVQGYDTL